VSKIFESSEPDSSSEVNTSMGNDGRGDPDSRAEHFSNFVHQLHPGVTFEGFVTCESSDHPAVVYHEEGGPVVGVNWPPSVQQTAQARPPASTARGVIKKAVNECLVLRNQQEIGLAPNAALYNRCAFPVMASFCYQKAGSLFACGPPMKAGLNNFAPGGWLVLSLYPTGAAVHWTACQGGLEDPDASPNLQWKGGVLRSSCGVKSAR